MFEIYFGPDGSIYDEDGKEGNCEVLKIQI